MTAEVAILRAYAFATQGKYAEAEQLLVSAPEALNTPSGADLLARIKFEQGDEVAARQIWEQIRTVDPANESVREALAAIDTQEPINDSPSRWWRCRKFVVAALLAILVGASFSLGKAWRSASSEPTDQQIASLVPPQPSVIAKQALEIPKINAKVLAELRNGILTNMTDKTMLVVSGGRGKYVPERVSELSVIVDSLSSVSGVPMTNIMFQACGVSCSTVTLSVVPR